MRTVKQRDRKLSRFFIKKDFGMINFYDIDDQYIKYLRKYDYKVLSEKSEDRNQTRKYVGIVFVNKTFKYFIPLSSYKANTYDSMYESVSLKKIGKMAVIRINNMIPVVDEVINPIDFSLISDKSYKFLLQNEYQLIKPREKEIRRDARIVYHYRINETNEGKRLYNICCDFKLLEGAAQNWLDNNGDNISGNDKEKILVGV